MARQRTSCAPLAVGDKVKIKTSLGSPLADKAPSVGTAGPLLVYDGLVNVTASLEEIPSDIADGRAPRTAVGIKKDGTILVVVADGAVKPQCRDDPS